MILGCIKAYMFIGKQALTDGIYIFLIANNLWQYIFAWKATSDTLMTEK